VFSCTQRTHRYAKLYELGQVKPTTIKVCFIGDAKAGKTTLMYSLQRKHSPKLKEERTAGMDIVKAKIDEAGDVVFCDFAGQTNFYKTHSLFFAESTTIYVLVVDLTKGDRELVQSSSFWLSFVKCSVGSSSKYIAVLVGSRGDTRNTFKLEALQTSLSARFCNSFVISEKPFALDCREGKLAEMDRLRSHIYELKRSCIEVQFNTSNFLAHFNSDC